MKKIALGLCLVAGVVLLAGCGDNKKGDNGQESSQNQNSQQANPGVEDGQELGGKKTLQALAMMGKDMVCTYEVPEEDNLQGTVYVAGNGQKIRTENTTAGDLEYANAIMDLEENMMYTWTKTKKMDEVTGMKMELNSLEEYSKKNEQAQSQGSQEQSGATGVQPDKKYDYDCRNWNKDASKFNPPADVEFMDLSNMMQNLQQNMPEGAAQEMPENMPQEMPENVQSY